MNTFVLFFMLLMLFGSTASAAEISGSVVSNGIKLPDQKVTLSSVNITQNTEAGMNYNFIPLAETATDRGGNYAFHNLNNGRYRINVTYKGITQGENIDLQGNAVVGFNLSGTIEGSVLKANQTLDGIPVYLFDASGIEVANTRTSRGGKYSFHEVNAGKGYFVEAIYEDVPYTKQVNASENADFMVHDSTNEGTIISVAVDHMILSRAPTGIKVEEYVEFINTGDKVFFSKDRTWLGISTPEGATRFQTDVMECCLQREKNAAWIDPMRPLLPGESYSAQISYVFNPESSENIFYKRMIYNTTFFTLVSDKNNGFGIESNYAKKEIIPIEGNEYEVLTFNYIPRDQMLETQITGYVPSRSEGEGINYLIPVLGAALIAAVSYPLLKNNMNKKPRRHVSKTIPSAQGPTQEAEMTSPQTIVVTENTPGKDITEMSFDELVDEKNATFESLMAFEQRFNAGEITELEYKDTMKDHREKAMRVIRQLKEAALNIDLNQSVPVLEKMISYIGDIDILEELLEREKEGENRRELKEIIEQRIEDIEQTA